MNVEDFINTIMEDNPDKIEYLQKILGYSLLAGNPLEIFIILYGLTRTGKGTLTSTIFNLLGDYAKNIMPNSLIINKNAEYEDDKLENQQYTMIPAQSIRVLFGREIEKKETKKKNERTSK